jgi:hypothetical protein
MLALFILYKKPLRHLAARKTKFDCATNQSGDAAIGDEIFHGSLAV